MKKILTTGLPWIWITIVVLLLDRLSKWWIASHLAPFEIMRMFPFFNLTLVYNKGAAYGFLNDASGWQGFFLGGLAIIVSCIIFVWLYRQSIRDYWTNIALSLILGGALGNVWDRVLYGYVIDYFDFHIAEWHFAIFNVADSAISIGAFMLIIYWLIPEKKTLKTQ